MAITKTVSIADPLEPLSKSFPKPQNTSQKEHIPHPQAFRPSIFPTILRRNSKVHLIQLSTPRAPYPTSTPCMFAQGGGP
ncbi:hypothetical protein BU26DRAFT_61762 [Trematosphaeria pertusa]|uniref:Uncharacterized protein n=1 Tax=Trematosphaeria pertusa TaxID=390896 RepID=A0A6A6I6Y3_9PLEO|nr:uncharacterized protein BU26DRAFT_61762 [Trematosphaeria pertusa]KAF2246096.1 hypothetical protein BU26DRAFT_61762 [Trematosphaeria pertusa]